MNQKDVNSLLEYSTQPKPELSPVRSDALLANRAIVELVLDALLAEAQERFGCWSALTPEEVKAWIDSRRVHWFANAVGEGRGTPRTSRPLGSAGDQG
jgi:hypothetical protein